MKMKVKMFSIISLYVLLFAGSIIPADSQEEMIRAKIGIQIRSGDAVTRAKTKDRLKSGDMLRIYVHPERNCHIYVIHADHKTATLLNLVQQKIQSSTLVMPSIQEFYQIDGQSPMESFTIICSPNELKEEMGVFVSGEAPPSKWAELEEKLVGKGNLDLSQQSEKPFSIAGNVRGAGGGVNVDPFISHLQIFSGRSILVKKYEFRLQK